MNLHAVSDQRVLELRGLTKSFGSVIANDEIDLHLDRGEILALLGENGAGKTTLMNMLFGHYRPEGGSIEVAGDDGVLQSLPLGHPQAAISAKIGMVHQHFTLADNLNALDNIMLGDEKLFSLGRDTVRARMKIEHIMGKSGLSVPLDVSVGSLSVGERQRVEILSALYRDVMILVLDEPTAVLTPQESYSLFDNISSMTKDGLSVIFISHKLREVLDFSDRIAVLRHGVKVGEMATCDADEKTIARMMVGAEVSEFVCESSEVSGVPLLCFNEVSVRGASHRDSLHNVDFTVREGEILGIAGISGNGQSVLAGILSGMLSPQSGDISIEGTKVSEYHPSIMVGLGVGRIPEDRHREGIVGGMTVSENLIIERLFDEDIHSYGFLKYDKIAEYAEKMCIDYDIRGPGVSVSARLLSGGNIQKLILARVFESNPRVILANQPTRGLDMGASAEVARRLLDARAKGVGVLLISEDLDEIISLSDRVMVMHDGKIFESPTREREKLGILMAGGVI